MKVNFKKLLVGTAIGLMITQVPLYASNSDNNDPDASVSSRSSVGSPPPYSPPPLSPDVTSSNSTVIIGYPSVKYVVSTPTDDGDKSDFIDISFKDDADKERFIEIVKELREHNETIVEGLGKQLNEKEKEIVKYLTTINELSEQLSSMLAASVSTQAANTSSPLSLDSSNEVSRLQQLSSQLQDQLQQLEKEKTAGTDSIKDLQKKLADKEDEATRLAQDLKNTSNNLGDLRLQLIDKESARYMATAIATRQQSQLNSAREEVNNLNRELQAAQARVNELQPQLDTANTQATNLEAERDAAQTSAGNLQDQLNAANAQLADLRDQLRRANEQASAARSSIPPQTSEGLPVDFDADGYLRFNQDIRDAYANVQARFTTIQEWAVHHYTNHGQAKGRRYK